MVAASKSTTAYRVDDTPIATRLRRLAALPARTGAVSTLALLGLILGATGCPSSTAPEPKPRKQAAAVTTASASASASAEKKPPKKPAERPKVKAKPVAEVKPAADDPLKGIFNLELATAGMKGSGNLVAEMDTDAGKLECDLYEDKAPITVANFAGLARGVRPWKDPNSDKWVKKPLFDGTVFHRIIKGFMVQGGDPKGNGSGGPGFVIPDEIWEGASHDERGLLCMANRGPNTNGSQFFILDKPALHLDGGYTIFGKCGPDAVVEKLASWKVRGQLAVDPPKIKKVTIKHQAGK